MIDDIITDLLRREGWPAYTCDPDDHGGATKGGITQGTLSAWRGHPCMPADVAALSEDEARAIYAGRFVRFGGTVTNPNGRPGFDQIADPALRALLVDWGVTSGPPTAVRTLQRVLNFSPSSVDGVLGPMTQAAANAGDPARLKESVLAQRESFYRRIAAEDPSQRRFLGGWLNRCHEFAA